MSVAVDVRRASRAEPALSPEGRAYAAERRRTRAIRFCIWAYIVLWILEGALRKWVFPGLANPLGLIREPFVAAAYLLAFRAGVFPRNFIVWVSAILCFVLILIGYFLIGLPYGVMAAGVWAYFWPIPFIFLIPRVMDQSDVHRVAKFLMLVAIPMALLMAVQFKSPAGSRINAIVGQEEYVESWSTKETYGEVRPSGTWSYVGGATFFYTLVAAIVFTLMVERGTVSTGFWLLTASSVALSTAVSKSRGQVYGIALAFVVWLLFGRAALAQRLNRLVSAALMLGVAILVLSQTTLVTQGVEVLQKRFEEGSSEGLVNRLRYNYLPSADQLAQTPFYGFGLGVGTNTGAIFLVGRRAFLLAESETPRVIMEFGVPLGILYGVGVRYGLLVLMVLISWRSARRGNLWPTSFLAATGPLVAAGTWGTPPVQAISVIGAGLCLAAARTEPKEAGRTP